MFKACKFRLYPNRKQIELINKNFGSSRYVYNHYLDKMKNILVDYVYYHLIYPKD